MLRVPGHEAYTRVLGEPVRYFHLGSGPPLVLLHGLGEAALVWYGNIAPLAEEFAVYAPDLLGHGHSGKSSQPHTPQVGTAFVTGLLDALDVSAAHLVGNSLGGLLAASVALTHPDRVRSLVLEDSAGLGHEIAGFLRAMSLRLVGEAMARPTQGGLRRLLRILLHDPACATDDLVEALHQERSLPGNKEAMLQALRAGVTIRGVKRSVLLTHSLAALQTPTLLVWGRQDPLFPVAQAERTARRLPRARLHVFEACGHWPHLEKRDEFNRLVAGFVREQEAIVNGGTTPL